MTHTHRHYGHPLDHPGHAEGSDPKYQGQHDHPRLGLGPIEDSDQKFLDLASPGTKYRRASLGPDGVYARDTADFGMAHELSRDPCHGVPWGPTTTAALTDEDRDEIVGILKSLHASNTDELADRLQRVAIRGQQDEAPASEPDSDKSTCEHEGNYETPVPGIFACRRCHKLISRPVP